VNFEIPRNRFMKLGASHTQFNCQHTCVRKCIWQALD